VIHLKPQSGPITIVVYAIAKLFVTRMGPRLRVVAVVPLDLSVFAWVALDEAIAVVVSLICRGGPRCTTAVVIDAVTLFIKRRSPKGIEVVTIAAACIHPIPVKVIAI
jgi:hypothetical protein